MLGLCGIFPAQRVEVLLDRLLLLDEAFLLLFCLDQLVLIEFTLFRQFTLPWAPGLGQAGSCEVARVALPLSVHICFRGEEVPPYLLHLQLHEELFLHLNLVRELFHQLLIGRGLGPFDRLLMPALLLLVLRARVTVSARLLRGKTL